MLRSLRYVGISIVQSLSFYFGHFLNRTVMRIQWPVLNMTTHAPERDPTYRDLIKYNGKPLSSIQSMWYWTSLTSPGRVHEGVL